MSLKSEYTAKIKSAADALGFLSCGISKADFFASGYWGISKDS